MPNPDDLWISRARGLPRGAPLVLLLLAPGCYAGAGESTDSAASEGPGTDDTGPGEGVGEDGCRPPARRLTLLSNRRYANAVRDLLDLPEAPVVSNGGGTSESLLPSGADRVNSALVFEYHDIAEAAADQAIAKLDALAPCGPGEDELTCAGALVDELGARAFRRPLTDLERSGLLDVYQVGREQDGDYAGGVRLVVSTLLQAPSFLYLSELGEPTGAGDYALTPWEVASQLSFFLADTLPDAALLLAAAEGRLADDAGVKAEVERMLEDPAVRANVTSLYLRWLGSDRVAGVEKASPDFTPALRAAMQKETALFMDDLLWRKGARLRDMLTSTTTWLDATLAGFYGVPAPAGEGFVEVDLPADQRAGVLTHGSLLASLSGVDQTSVVYRGLFVARDLLCIDFPPPPAGATEAGLDESKGERARSEWRMQNQPCMGCHASFDPFGLMFENYDELGRWRTEMGGQPIDASWDIGYPESVAGPTEGAVELASRLAGADEVSACAAVRLTSYALARPYDLEVACWADEHTAAFQESGADLVALVRQVATSPMLRYRSPEEGP